MPQTFLLNLPEAKNGTVRGPLQTHQLSAAFCLLAYFCFFSTSCFSLLSFMLYFFSLTACHHIFSQLPTTSYSATTDLNSDLALSVPLRREREIPYLRLPPLLPPPPHHTNNPSPSLKVPSCSSIAMASPTLTTNWTISSARPPPWLPASRSPNSGQPLISRTFLSIRPSAATALVVGAAVD